MKTNRITILRTVLLGVLLLSLKLTTFGQGRVVINEYMSWTNNGCGTTAEFVELLNFGPGPVNIGCYILTEGDYSITIPPNTILQPGQFYVIAGQDFLPVGCGNIDSTVTVHLNWNKVNCTSAPIPTTGDGLFTDGGSANEQVVLLDRDLRIVDAVVRNFPVEPSSNITTSSVNGGCTSRTFDLDLMNIHYETIGESTGRGNTFARKLDGDCSWVKETRQSANATNNTPTETSDVTYNLTLVRTQACDSTGGAISIYVNAPNYNDVFPMNYTLAYDRDSNAVFELTDTYTYGVDSTAPSIEVGGLQPGNYRISVGSSKGCNLKTFDFHILSCSSILPVNLISFKHTQTKNNRHYFEWMVSDAQNLRTVILEQSFDNAQFTTASIVDASSLSGIQAFHQNIPATGHKFFRLKMISRSGEFTYSPTINTWSSVSFPHNRFWPNPATNLLTVELSGPVTKGVQYNIYNMGGSLVQKGFLTATERYNTSTIAISNLPNGMYHASIIQPGVAQPISFRFVKQ